MLIYLTRMSVGSVRFYGTYTGFTGKCANNGNALEVNRIIWVVLCINRYSDYSDYLVQRSDRNFTLPHTHLFLQRYKGKIYLQKFALMLMWTVEKVSLAKNEMTAESQWCLLTVVEYCSCSA